MTHPLDSQHEVLDVVVFDSLTQHFQILLEVRCGAEAQLTLEVVDQRRWIGRVARYPLPDHPFGGDHQFPSLELARPPHDRQDRQRNTEQHRPGRPIRRRAR